MRLREKRGTYVFDVVFEDTKEKGEVTLDSGAGVSVAEGEDEEREDVA